MNKLKIALMLCLALAFCQAAMATQTIVTEANELRIDLIEYDPSPVQPGTSTTLSFEVINLGSSEINDMEIKLVDEYPFEITSDKTITLEKLEAGEKAELSFEIKVNKDAVEDTYQLSIQYFSEKLSSGTSSPFDIEVVKEVSAVETSIEVKGTKESTTAIEPGHTADVGLTIENPSSTAMRDVVAKLELSGSDIPFAPLGTTSEKKIDLIPGQDSGEVHYTLIASPDAEAGLYKVPITIRYYDSQGYLRNMSDIVGLIVGSKSNLQLEIESTELTTDTETGNLVVKLINAGTTDVKFLNLALLDSEDYEIISSSSMYIGDVDSDDYETAEFRLKMNEEEALLKFDMEFKDANNIAYEESKVLPVKLYSAKELGKENGSAWTWVIVILVLVGGYFGYKRYKKSKQ